MLTIERGRKRSQAPIAAYSHVHANQSFTLQAQAAACQRPGCGAGGSAAVKRAPIIYASDVEVFLRGNAGRSEIDFLCRLRSGPCDAGARTSQYSGHSGVRHPHQFGEMIQPRSFSRVPNADKAVFSVHCHIRFWGLAGPLLAAVTARSAPGRVQPIMGFGEARG